MSNQESGEWGRLIDLGVMEALPDWENYTGSDMLRLLRDRLRQRGLRTPREMALLADINATLETWGAVREREREQTINQLLQRVAELERDAVPAIPSPPPWDPVFDWYYRYGKPDGMTLKGLAGKLGYSNHIYREHGKYKEQYGKAPMPDQWENL